MIRSYRTVKANGHPGKQGQPAPKAGRHTAHTRAARTTTGMSEGEHRAEQFCGFTHGPAGTRASNTGRRPRQADTQGGQTPEPDRHPTPRQAHKAGAQTRTHHTRGRVGGRVACLAVLFVTASGTDPGQVVCPVASFVILSGSWISRGPRQRAALAAVVSSDLFRSDAGMRPINPMDGVTRAVPGGHVSRQPVVPSPSLGPPNRTSQIGRKSVYPQCLSASCGLETCSPGGMLHATPLTRKRVAVVQSPADTRS